MYRVGRFAAHRMMLLPEFLLPETGLPKVPVDGGRSALVTASPAGGELPLATLGIPKGKRHAG